MNQWEIYDYPFALEGSHPVLIISAPVRAGNEAISRVNGLFCQTARPHVPLKKFHFILDSADGLDAPTLVRCDHFHELQREEFGRKRGIVSIGRRLELYRKILECFALPPGGR